MNFKKILLIALLFCILITYFCLNAEVLQYQRIELQHKKITEVTYIDDEWEPEMILTLDNELRLLAKASTAIFFEGQSVSIYFENDFFKLILLVEDSDGKERGKIIFYRLGGNSHFYRAI